MAETLTLLHLGGPPTLARALRSTNAVGSMISTCRSHACNGKRWRDGQMALRWCAAGLVEASRQFRRVTATYTYPSSGLRWNAVSLLKPAEPTARITT